MKQEVDFRATASVPAECAEDIGLPPARWGLMLVVTEDGERVTLAGDPDYVGLIAEGSREFDLSGTHVSTRPLKFVRPGWYGEWEVPSNSAAWLGLPEERL